MDNSIENKYKTYSFKEAEEMTEWLNDLADNTPDTFTFNVEAVWSTPQGLYVLMDSWDSKND